ncbi:MAG TPA: cysteine desulfurase family protein [Flavobacteriales bacterium]
MKVYLDNAATTPLDKEVLAAMMPYLTEHFGNPSSTHSFGRKTKTAIENARRTIAKALNCTPGEIYFTSGGTEADNLAMHSSVKDLGCKHIITSPIEHSAVIKTAHTMEEQGLAKLSLVRLNQDGSVNLEHLEELLANNEKSYVSLMHGNNEIGNLLPLEKVSALCKQYGAIFHSDTVQTMGHYKFDLQAVPVDFLNASAHKFHGPKGVGFIYVNKNLKINPDITGGGQERGLRGGTENLYGIVGLAKAIELCYQDLEGHAKYVSDLKQYMVSELKKAVPGIVFNGQSASLDSLYTVLNVTFPESSNADMLLFHLDLEGVCCSGGSACSSGATKGSHVLEAIGALKPGCASIRFSFSRFTTKEEIDYAISKVKELQPVYATA